MSLVFGCPLSNYCSNLCSNLCSAPVVAMAEDPPDPVERWILSACATWPKPKSTPDIQATLLYAGLTLAGAMQLRDFEGLTSTEAMAIWPHLRETPMGFVDHLFSCLPRALLAHARKYGEVLPGAIRQEQRRIAESGLPRQLTPVVVAELTNVRDRTPPRAQSAPGLETLKWCMKSLRTARTSKVAPPPSAFAEVVRRMGIVPLGAMLARWQEVATSAPPDLPVARAKWLASLQPDDRSKFHVVLRSGRQWHRGVSALRSTRQQFNYGVVQRSHAQWVRGRLVGAFLTRMLSSLSMALHCRDT